MPDGALPASAPAISCDELAAVFRQLPCFVTVIARDGRIVYNSKYLGGHAEDGTLGQMADFCLDEPFKAPFWSAFYACRDRRMPGTVRSKVLHPEAPGHAWMECALSPVVIDCAVRYVAAAVTLADPPAQPCAGTPLPALPPRPPRVPSRAKWLSPLAERIVSLLANSPLAWTPCDAIADRLGEQPSHRFKAVLSGLGERGILEASSGAGYRLVLEAG